MGMIRVKRKEETVAERIYLADDERNIRELIAAFLSREGYEVESFENGNDLLEACENDLPDLVILDVMMPGVDGLAVCSTLRRNHGDLPIIIVSAKDSPYDRVTGLTLGCDDYLVKPFLPIELVARVKAVLRRSRKSGPAPADGAAPGEVSFGALRLSPERRDAFLGGERLPLTPAEFDFLVYLVERENRAVSREELLEALWGIDWRADTRAADDLVKRLRRKLKAAGGSVSVETVWGFGFRIAEGEGK